MELRSTFPQRPADWVARAFLSGLVAVTAMLAALLFAYAIVAFYAGIAPADSKGAQLMAGWFRTLTTGPLFDLRAATPLALFGWQIAIGLAAALVYARLEPHWAAPNWARGSGTGLGLGLLTAGVLLPLAGMGPFGVSLGAGPLPLLITLAAYLVYGLVLVTLYGPAGDALLGPDTPEERLALERTTAEGARGAVVGAALGLVAGVALGPMLLGAGGPVAFGLPPIALALGSALVGGGLGELVGSLLALAVPPVPVAVAVPVGLAPEMAAVAPPIVRPAARQLQVVAVHGVCPRGYRLGDTFTCTPAGEVSPALCPAATAALQPLLAGMVEGRPDAPERVACPIYDHMLVFQLGGMATATAPA